MIPVTQTVFYEEDAVVKGNCLQAAVASIYELPLAAVPHFIQFEKWGEALALYVEGRGNILRLIKPPAFAPRPARVVMAFGKSPRGNFDHAVVWQDGVIVHDPHPSRDGLDGEPYEFWDILAEDGVAP